MKDKTDHTPPVLDHMDAAITHTAPMRSLIDDATFNMQVVRAHIENVIAYV